MGKGDKHVVAVDRLKVVVRRLPPTLPEAVFWESVKTWVTDETVTWRSFVQGKPGKRNARENVPGRAYVTFRTHDAVAAFSRDFDGHVYRDKQGVESRVVIEFAPFQKIPPSNPKPDNKYISTIDKDPYFISFVEELKQVKKLSEQDTLDAYAQAAATTKQEHTTTPLLEALKAGKAAATDAALARRHALAQQDKPLSKKAAKAAKAAEAAAATAAAAAAAEASTSTPAKKSKPSKKQRERERERNGKDREKEKKEEAPIQVPKILLAKKDKDKDVPPHVAPAASTSASASTSKPAQNSAPSSHNQGKRKADSPARPLNAGPKPQKVKQAAPQEPTTVPTPVATPATPQTPATPTQSAPPRKRERGGGPSARGFQMALSGARGGAGPGRGRGAGAGTAPPSASTSAANTAPPAPSSTTSGGTAANPPPPPSGGHGRGKSRGRGRGAGPVSAS